MRRPDPARTDGTAHSKRMFVTVDDVNRAAYDLATGAVIGQAFANFYVTSRADRRSVASVV